MKKVFLSLLGLATYCATSAQLTVGLNGNFSKYGGDLNRSTPGIGLKVGYQKERFGFELGFTNGFAITEEGTVIAYNNTTGGEKSVPAEARLSFKTISLMSNRTLIGDEETTGSMYLGFGASFVIASYKEKVKGSLESGYTVSDLGSESENGFTLNGLIGGEYRLGKPAVFGEVGFSYPANTVNNAYVTNAIPAHLIFNLGVRLRLGE
jgi:hypothetical protein